MALANYSDLGTAVASWMDRTGDSAITSNIGDFVTLCEARMFNGSGERGDTFHSPPLRIRAMETSADITIDAQTEALPTGFLQARRFYLNSSPISQLDFFPPMDFWGRFISTVSGQPTMFTIEGEDFVFGPSPDGTYTGKVLYWKRLDSLQTSSTNAIMTNFPNIYLFGTLLEAYLFLDDDRNIQKFYSLYSGAIKGAQRADQMDRFSGAVMEIHANAGAP